VAKHLNRILHDHQHGSSKVAVRTLPLGAAYAVWTASEQLARCYSGCLHWANPSLLCGSCLCF
jgi:hypothetical protein